MVVTSPDEDAVMDAPEMHRAAVARSCAVVDAITEDQWDAATPCTEWDVRDLVNHMVAENLWAVPLLAGSTIDEVGDDFEGEVLGDDPRQTHREAAERAQETADTVDLSRTVHLSFGDVEAEFFLRQRATDMIIHAWDLAVATGQDTSMDPELARLGYEATAPLLTPETRPYAPFGPEVEVPGDAPWADRLLGLVGRDPSQGSQG